MLRRNVSVLVVFLFALALAAPVFAQESRVYVRVELWDVKREMWPAFVKQFEKYDQPVFEKLFSDGVINEWGIDSATLHSPEGYTHGVWYAATSMAALEKAGDAFEAAYKALGEKEQARVDADFANMLIKHRDYMLLVLGQKAKAAKLDKAFFYEVSVRIKSGEGSSYVGYWNQYTKPVLQKLMDEGVVVAYGRSTEEITTDNPAQRSNWYVVRDMAGHDKVQAALRATWDAMTEEQRRARRAAAMAMTEPGSFREYMSQIIHWTIREQ